MKVEKGQLLKIAHRRKGTFVAVALRDFDSEEVFSFPVALAEEEVVEGLSYYGRFSGGWMHGDKIPCRASLAKIVEVLEQEKSNGKGK